MVIVLKVILELVKLSLSYNWLNTHFSILVRHFKMDIFISMKLLLFKLMQIIAFLINM